MRNIGKQGLISCWRWNEWRMISAMSIYVKRNRISLRSKHAKVAAEMKQWETVLLGNPMSRVNVSDVSEEKDVWKSETFFIVSFVQNLSVYHAWRHPNQQLQKEHIGNCRLFRWVYLITLQCNTDQQTLMIAFSVHQLGFIDFPPAGFLSDRGWGQGSHTKTGKNG